MFDSGCAVSCHAAVFMCCASALTHLYAPFFTRQKKKQNDHVNARVCFYALFLTTKGPCSPKDKYVNMATEASNMAVTRKVRGNLCIKRNKVKQKYKGP